MERYTTAKCFSTFVLPYVMFVPEFRKREKIAAICRLGWNVGLFPDAEQRERHVDMAWKMAEADNAEPPPLGLERGFKQDMQALVARRRDLFPWLNVPVLAADLVRENDRRDLLRVKTEEGVQEVELVTRLLHPSGLPLIVELLESMRSDTAAQADLMRRAGRTPGLLSAVETAEMVAAYCMQRAGLIGYRRMLMAWRDVDPAPRVEREIDYWLEALEEIEENSKAVLAVLAEKYSAEA
jgi:hypothetical protein